PPFAIEVCFIHVCRALDQLDDLVPVADAAGRDRHAHRQRRARRLRLVLALRLLVPLVLREPPASPSASELSRRQTMCYRPRTGPARSRVWQPQLSSISPLHFDATERLMTTITSPAATISRDRIFYTGMTLAMTLTAF